jgi:hypothetical protein
MFGKEEEPNFHQIPPTTEKSKLYKRKIIKIPADWSEQYRKNCLHVKS